MKKLASLYLCLLMILSFSCVSVSAANEGNIYTVGTAEDEADFTSLKDAIASASDGDTIQLVGNITESKLELNKSITIDTNGYVWTGGTTSKENCGSVSSGVTVSIINSKRTQQINSDPYVSDMFD